MREFRRVQTGQMIGGIAVGLAHYFQCDVRLIRIALVALAMLSTGGLAVVLLYLVLMWTTPRVATAAELPSRE